MKNFIHNTSSNVAVLMAAIGAVVHSHGAPAADHGPRVTVINAADNPVPVVQQGPVSISGSVTLSGTPNVNVANVPTVNLATGAKVNVANIPTVDLASGAKVKILADAPVPVSLSGGQTVRIRAWLFHETATDNAGRLLYTVPSGKRLLVSAVSAWAQSDNGGKWTAELSYGPSHIPSKFLAIPLEDHGEIGSAFSTHDFNANVGIAADFEAGEALYLRLHKYDGDLLHAQVFITGTLVDATDALVDVDFAETN